MWCKQCGQDVPGVASPNEGGFCCARCGLPLDDGVTDRPSQESPCLSDAKADTPAPSQSDPPCLYDSWELDEQLRHVQRVLGSAKGATSRRELGRRESAHSREVARLDPPHTGAIGWHRPLKKKLASRRNADSRSGNLVLSLLTWSALSLGLMAFVCGGVLLGWSIISGRENLWSIGMPIALGGQIGLLVGLVLQLDRLWHDNRATAAKLDHVDDQLHDLETTTTMLSTSHDSAGGTFYSHLADGAGPQMLLTDLKSQLDLLAVKIGQQR